MQTAWIQMRHRVTRRLIRIHVIWHQDNIFTKFEINRSTYYNRKFEADENLADDTFFSMMRDKLCSIIINIARTGYVFVIVGETQVNTYLKPNICRLFNQFCTFGYFDFPKQSLTKWAYSVFHKFYTYG